LIGLLGAAATSKIRDYFAQIQTHSLDMIGQALHFSRHAIAATGKAVSNNRRLDTQWEQVAVQTICPPPSGGFHLFDGERDPAIPMDSPVTECAACCRIRPKAGYWGSCSEHTKLSETSPRDCGRARCGDTRSK
jgi:hypothetical protein